MFHKFRHLAVLTILLPFIPGLLFAQSPRELRIGVMNTGTINPGAEEWFSFRSTETGFLVVETFGDLDTYLEAYDSSRTLIGENDDGGEEYNAKLEIYTEPGNTYQIKLRCYDEDENGPYRILASIDPVTPDTEMNTSMSRAVTIRLGESFPVLFRSPDESRWYRYDISRTGVLFMVQTRGSLDTTISLYDSNGNLIEEDDDSGEDMNALISVRRTTGTVFIEVSEYSGLMGRCTLHAEFR